MQMEQDKGKRQETQKVREKEKSQLASDETILMMSTKAEGWTFNILT